MTHGIDAETQRLAADRERTAYWRRFGPYLAERQWATVREDYSADGTCWSYFPHDHARSRAYRWGEDGLLGISDRKCRLCFALALWNGRDPILKERLFGLTGPEGNHGEDVKELYFYLDATPTHSYMKALYKYPQAEFPYARLVEENARRGRDEREFELADTGVFDEGRYFDVFAEYAKAAPDDVTDPDHRREPRPRGGAAARAADALVPQHLVLGPPHRGARAEAGDRGRRGGECGPSTPTLGAPARGRAGPDGARPGAAVHRERDERRAPVRRAERRPYVKDAFHEYVVDGRREARGPGGSGTKAACRYLLDVPAGGEGRAPAAAVGGRRARRDEPFGDGFEQTFAVADRRGRRVLRRATPARASTPKTGDRAAGLRRAALDQAVLPLRRCATGSRATRTQPPPPAERWHGRKRDWPHLFNRDVISMPDKWEYPWFAAWDLAFHMIAFAEIDPEFAKQQLILFLREWYMHPNGQLPAYEFAFGDVNPPVHAWAVLARLQDRPAPAASATVSS